MFRCGLLSTTALVLAVSLSILAAPPAAMARDRNNDFLCTYGQFDVSYAHSAGSGSNHSTWTHVAVPITGRGKTVDRVIVKEGQNSHTYSAEFSVGIYGNSRSGLPGKLIVGATAIAPMQCGTVALSIKPTKLGNRKTYWIEETTLQRSHVKRELYWAINPKSKQKAYVKTFSSSNGHSHSSPWTEQSAGPYVKLK